MRKTRLWALALSMTLMMTTPTAALAGEGFYTEGAPELEAVSGNIEAIEASSTNVVLEMVGDSAFLNVIGRLDNGEKVDLTDWVSFTSSDADVVYPYRGRLLAKGVGETTVTMSYKGLEINVYVTVRAPLTLPDNIPAAMSSNIDISIASGMVFCTWMPRKLMKSWVDSSTGNYKEYYPGQSYTGVLYTQNDWNTETEFLNAVALDDFYVPLPRANMSSTYTQPKYGNDCSGFLSIAWELSYRHNTKELRDGIKSGKFEKVGDYNPADAYTTSSTARARLKTKLLTAYESLQQGDAVVYRNDADTAGHTFIIFTNDVSEKKIYAFEQTNPNAELTTWTYSSLAAKYYLPFRKK